MAMRSMWKGAVSFGLVSIPVKLYKAVDDGNGVGLCNTHRLCGTAVKSPKYCPTCSLILEAGDLQKAFPEDRKKEHCIPLTDQELEGLQLKSTRVIQVDGFIEAVPDIRYYDTIYVLEPEDLGERAFALFEMAMRNTGMLGVAKITTGSKEHLCVIRPSEDGLLYVQTLHWASDLRDTSELKRPKVEITEKELALARMIIDTLPRGVSLPSYHNEYGEALLRLVEDKKAGREITAPEAPTTVSLEEQLMATLAAAKAS